MAIGFNITKSVMIEHKVLCFIKEGRDKYHDYFHTKDAAGELSLLVFHIDPEITPRHDKVANGSIKSQLKRNGYVMIVVHGESAWGMAKCRLYLKVRPADLDFKVNGGWCPLLESDIVDAYKSLTKEDILRMYNFELFHDLVVD